MVFEPAAGLVLETEMSEVVREWGAGEDAEVSNDGFKRGFGLRMRGTLDGVKKEIPIPISGRE